MLKLLVSLSLASLAFAQLPIHFGLKGGYVNNERDAKNKIFPFEGGPYIELNLPVLPAIETGLMIEKYDSPTGSVAVFLVPVLLKKKFNAVAIKPYLSGGATMRFVPSRSERTGGITVAAGVSPRFIPIKIEPEIRYTQWIHTSSVPRDNQLEFLVGIRF